jgi:hypothetical protein
MKNCVVMEKSIGHPWDQDGCSLQAGGGWSKSQQEAFVSFPEGAYARARFTGKNVDWTRAVTMVRANPAVPMFFIQDTFTPEEAKAAKVQSMTFLAQGPVVEPGGGKLTCPLRIHPVSEHKAPMPLPSVDVKFSLDKGLHRFGFTGKYPIEWDVYVLSDSSRQGVLGNWAVTPWGGHITDKEERQYILRLRGQDSFRTLIIAWQKGERPKDLNVQETGQSITVVAGGTTVVFNPRGYRVAGAERVERVFEK